MTKVMTSYSIGNNEKPTEYHTTATFTVTAAASTVTLRSPVAHRLEPRRKKGDVIYKWMFHPWSRSVLCYECYTNKPGNWDWVKCNSGPDHNEACSERPVDADGFPYTTTATETSSRLRFTRTTYTTDATGIVTTATYTTLHLSQHLRLVRGTRASTSATPGPVIACAQMPSGRGAADPTSRSACRTFTEMMETTATTPSLSTFLVVLSRPLLSPARRPRLLQTLLTLRSSLSRRHTAYSPQPQHSRL
jgi:hypothetical protein